MGRKKAYIAYTENSFKKLSCERSRKIGVAERKYGGQRTGFSKWERLEQV